MSEEDKNIIREAVKLSQHLKEQIPDRTYVKTVRIALSLMLAEIIVSQTLADPFGALEALKDILTYIAFVKQKVDDDRYKVKEHETIDIKAN